MSGHTMTFADICRAVLAHPKVEQGFVQELHSLDKKRAIRIPGGGGGWINSQSTKTTFRVWVCGEGTSGDAEADDVREAVRLAFTGAKIQPPEMP